MRTFLRQFLALLFLPLFLLGVGCSVSSSSTPGAKPPVAAIIADMYQTAPGNPILFSGLGSSDPQNQFLTYTWNFGDGSSGSGVRLYKGYAQTGTYTVTLTVTNQSNLSASASIQVLIVLPSQVPVANAGGPYSGAIGSTITFNGSGSTDPQGQPLTYAWTFGDGGKGTGVAPTHTYTSPGTFTVTLVVTNSSGIPASATARATIAYPAPTVTINGPYTGKPTLPIAFTSTTTEPFDNSFTYQWSFGDGSYASVANPSHTYAAAGTYAVSLTVIGQYNESATVTSTATITAQSTTPTFGGVIQSGTTPIVGAHVHLLAAGTSGYGQPAVSLLGNTGYTDAAGPYLLSSGSGTFSFPAGLGCTIHQQLYVYATGGSVGSSSNAAIGLLATIGACGNLTPTTSLTVDEATTVAAAYALSGYATTPATVSAPATAAAQIGISNAFLNSANLASSTSGRAVAATASATPPQSTVNTLANILNACVAASATSTACTTLFSTTQSTETASAALAIAHAQGANVAALFALQAASTSPFAPALSAAPHDFALPVTYGGLSGYGTSGLAIDGNGNVWVQQFATPYGSAPYLTEFTSNGTVQQSFASTCNGLTVGTPNAIAIDPSNNVFLLGTSGATYYDGNGNQQSYSTAQYCTLSAAGVMISPPGGYGLGGSQSASLSLYDFAIGKDGTAWFPSTTLLSRDLHGNNPLGGQGYLIGNAPYAYADAIDGAGNFWLSSPVTNGLMKLSSTGTLLSSASGFLGGGLSVPASIAIDNNGNVWAINTQTNYPNAGVSISKLSSTGTPLSGTGFQAGLQTPYSLAIDGAGHAWVAQGYSINGPALSVVELDTTGAPLASFAHANNSREYLNGPQSLTLDSAGSVWVSNGLDYTVTQFIGASVPVVTPLAANLAAPYNNPASRP